VAQNLLELPVADRVALQHVLQQDVEDLGLLSWHREKSVSEHSREGKRRAKGVKAGKGGRLTTLP